MANKSINSIITNKMHKPISKDGFVLYPKVDGYTGESEGNTQAEKSQIYLTQSKKTFNSPTNIRKLFVTRSKVYIEYWGTPVVHDNVSRYTSMSVYNAKDGLKENILNMLNYRQNLSKYNMEKAINKDAKAPEKINMTGNFFGILSSPYTCNNIEELYFDYSVLFGQELQPYIQPLAGVLQACLMNQEKPGITESNIFADLITQFAMGGAKNIRKRFPRLRIVAMISKLDRIAIAGPTDIHDKGTIKHASIGDNLLDLNIPWLDYRKDIILQSGSMVIVSRINKDIARNNKNFIVKDNQYKYDSEVLKGLVSAYVKMIEDYERQAKYGKVELDKKDSDDSKDVGNTVQSDIEKELLMIEQKYGTKALKNIMVASLSGVPKKKIFIDISKPNRKRLAGLIGYEI